MVERARLRQARARLLEPGRADARQPGGRRSHGRLHGEPARGVRHRAGGAHRRRHERAGHGPDPRSGRGVRAAADGAGPRLRCGRARRGRRRRLRARRRRPRDRRGRRGARRRGPRLRPRAARQRRVRHRRLPGRHPAGLRARACRSSTASRPSRSPTASPRRTSTGPTARRPTRCPRPMVATVLEGGRRAALPDAQGPDGGQEGRDRDAGRDHDAGRLQPGPAHAATPVARARSRSSARAPRRPRPSSTSSRGWASDDPALARVRRGRHQRDLAGDGRVRTRRSPRPVAASPSAPPSSATYRTRPRTSWPRTASARSTTSPVRRTTRTPAPRGHPPSRTSASAPSASWWRPPAARAA